MPVLSILPWDLLHGTCSFQVSVAVLPCFAIYLSDFSGSTFFSHPRLPGDPRCCTDSPPGSDSDPTSLLLRSLTFGVPLSAKCYLGPCFRPPTQAAARTMLPAHLPPSGLPSQVHGLTSACSGLRSSSLEQVLHLPGLGAVQLCSSGGAAAQKSRLLPARTIRLTDPHPSMSFKVV